MYVRWNNKITLIYYNSREFESYFKLYVIKTYTFYKDIRHSKPNNCKM